MNKYIHFFFTVVFSMTMIALISLSECKEKDNLPNFIIIMADDLGYGDIGCYGNNRIMTPNIDRLAAEGLKFTDYHANGPVCTPTRAALLTGRYQQRSGMEGVIYVGGETRQYGIDKKEITFAEVLKTKGYATGVIGKWHLGYKKVFNPIHQGFDVFKGYVSGNIDYISHYDNAGIYDWWHNLDSTSEEGYVTDLITLHSCEFIEQYADQPFCLYVAHEAPHWPYQGRSDKADRYPGVNFESQGSRPDKLGAYKEMVEIMDESVGKIVNKLVELDLEENTLVIFCSDNGAVQIGDNGGLRGYKTTLWEGGHRVPAIAWWPGKINPGITNDLTCSMDIFPTMVNLTGIEGKILPEFDGINITPILFDDKSFNNRKIFWRYRNFKCARQGDWKIILADST
ncbi:sulfatase-like hydrolase/transferase [Bacteroidota bacterium]